MPGTVPPRTRLRRASRISAILPACPGHPGPGALISPGPLAATRAWSNVGVSEQRPSRRRRAERPPAERSGDERRQDERRQDERRGRIRNPQWTRQAIIDALLGSINEGNYAPTARGIAERAGVSERSVFTHFRDIDDLREAAGEHQHERISAELRPISPQLRLVERVDEVLAQRERVFALQARIRVMALWYGPLSGVPAIDELLREQLAEVFAPELAAAAEPGELLDLLELNTGWSFRYPLEIQRGYDPGRVTRTSRRAVLVLLGA